MKKAVYSITIVLLLASCVAKKEYIKVSHQNKELNSELTGLNRKLDERKTEIAELKKSNEKLKTTIDSLHQEYTKLNEEYEEATRTSQYYYQKGIDALNNNENESAITTFRIIVEKYPNDNYAKEAKKRISELKKKSSSNYYSIKKKITGKTTKEKVSIIENAKQSFFFIKKDENKLNELLAKYNQELEAELYISVKDDKMQSCKFYQTSRNTDQYVSGANLRFELYIVHLYSGKKYFGLNTRYSADDWMFYEKVTIRGSNDYQVKITTEYPEKQTKSSGQGVKEWSNNTISDSDRYKLIKISEANEVFVRYDGKYRYDMTLNFEQMKAFREIVGKYKKL